MSDGFKAPHKHYERLYKSYLRGRTVRSVLELGVAEGDSLRAWLDWFPGSRVIGVDIKATDNALALADTNDRCEIFVAGQCSPLLLELGKFDLIVDDASHMPNEQEASLELLWPQLNPGGLYVIEDLETSYWVFVGYPAETQAPIESAQNYVVEAFGATRAIMQRLKGLADYLTADYAKQTPPEMFPGLEGLEAVHFHPNIAFLEKAQ